MTATLISIVGPPGCGKTTLAAALVDALGANLIREDYAGNPFLASAYLGDAAVRLPAQMYFLISRVAQLAEVAWPASGVCVSDYGFCQDRIFARINLSADEFDLYEPVRQQMETATHPPDLMILLDASEEELLQRIAARGRQFERVMNSDFLSQMRQSYAQATSDVTCPVIRIDNGERDLRQEANLRSLVGEIRKRLSGVNSLTG